MGQQEVYDFLVQNKKGWYTSKEISESIDASIGSVTMSLKKLRKANLVKFKTAGKRNTYSYQIQN